MPEAAPQTSEPVGSSLKSKEALNIENAPGKGVYCNVSMPTVEEVERIAASEDPVIRNLQITQCYHELSQVLAPRTGLSANWCTFATWASKQAGQTIRKEDLARLLENRLRRSSSAARASEQIAATASAMEGEPVEQPQQMALTASNFGTAIDRASDAVSRGNKKVFEEIGREFARFYETCLDDQTPGVERIDQFCQELRAGEPPEGQDYLRRAFRHYYQALFEQDAKARAEFVLLANVEIGLHEQTRLQPEIAESLDAGFVSSLQFTRRLLALIYPFGGWFSLANIYARRLLGRPTALDLAIRALFAAARFHLRQVITETMMTIALPSGVLLRLGQDLDAAFPELLMQISNPELHLLLQAHDPTPDSLVDSGALDWADLPDRLHFIIDLFR
ncbi:MAG TPA: hypothetical protein VE553_06795, partial [Candidatus Binatia bacterium]|nr:hypothetical protein [Candidatus Binatia bacterium]